MSKYFLSTCYLLWKTREHRFVWWATELKVIWSRGSKMPTCGYKQETDTIQNRIHHHSGKCWRNPLYTENQGINKKCHRWKFSGLILNSGFWGWLSFQRKSAPKCWLRQIIIAFLISFQIIWTQSFKLEIIPFCRHPASFKILKFRILENFMLSPMQCRPRWDAAKYYIKSGSALLSKIQQSSVTEIKYNFVIPTCDPSK